MQKDYSTAIFNVYGLNIIKVVFNMFNHLSFYQIGHLMHKSLSLSALLLSSTLILGGCQWFRVYTIDLPQGTPITQSVAQKVQVGMTQQQVLYVLGSPALKDTLAPNRWDYLYDYTAGTDGKRAGKPNIKNASQYLTITFDDNKKVAKIEGISTLPQ